MNDAAEGLNPVGEVGPSAMVLITHHRHVEKLGLNHDVANKARGSPVRVHVDKRQALEGFLAHDVAVPQELIAATYSKQHATVIDIRAQLGAHSKQLVADNALLTVATASDKRNVDV